LTTIELVGLADLTVNEELSRSRTSKAFLDRLVASVREIGLAEPLKAARTTDGRYLVVDGVLRLDAIRTINREDPTRFRVVPVYVVDWDRRFEIRFQSDIYQDLLPSQMASLVEHLHRSEGIAKSDIARYIGVSPATLRNYTGLSRLRERGGLFALVVDLMDAGVLPASNPYAWLRLSDAGIREVLEWNFADGDDAEAWIEGALARARAGKPARYSIRVVEEATGDLPPDCYRHDEAVRQVRRELGRRRSRSPMPDSEPETVRKHLARIAEESPSSTLRTAASNLAKVLGISR